MPFKMPSEEGLLSGQASETVHDVRDVFYHVHSKKGADENAPKSMRVDYKIGFHRYKSEWVCVEHAGFARRRAEEWWQARSDHEVPSTAEEAVALANAGALAFTESITVRSVAGEKFDCIVKPLAGCAQCPFPLPKEMLTGNKLQSQLIHPILSPLVGKTGSFTASRRMVGQFHDKICR